MTTVAYKDRTMASDTQASFGNYKRSSLGQKIYEVKGGLIGRSGSADDVHTFNPQFFEIQNEQDFTVFLEQQAETYNTTTCLFVKKINPYTVYWGQSYKREDDTYDYTVTVYDVSDGSGIACGSGGEYAEVAMYCGQSAEEAVRTASNFDVYTNDCVDVFKI